MNASPMISLTKMGTLEVQSEPRIPAVLPDEVRDRDVEP